VTRLRIVGVDPGFANVGFSILELYPEGGMDLVDTRLVTTEPNNKQADDDQIRLIHIEDEFRSFIDGRDIDILAIEAPTAGLMPGRGRNGGWGVNPITVRTSALVWGAIHGICRDRGIYCVKIGLGDIKKVLCGKKTASKQDVIDVVKEKFPAYDRWPTTKKVEHVADAVGIALVAQNNPVVTVMMRRLRTGETQ